jgi:hypothetical protein
MLIAVGRVDVPLAMQLRYQILAIP